MILYIVSVFHPQKLIYKFTFFWLMSLLTLFKIHKEIARWEKLFPKLEEWAQELEQFPLKNSQLFDEEAPP